MSSQNLLQAYEPDSTSTASHSQSDPPHTVIHSANRRNNGVIPTICSTRATDTALPCALEHDALSPLIA